MANDQHAEGEADKLKGNVKEGVGKATGNKDLENEGKADQAEGAMHNAAGDVKDAARNVKDAAKK